MLITPSYWQMPPPYFALLGISLGILGALSLLYDLLARPKILLRCVWGCASGLVIALVLLGSFLIGVGPERLTAEFSPGVTWIFVGFASFWGVSIQLFLFISPPQIRPPLVTWPKALLLPFLLSSVLLGFGAGLVPQGGNSFVAVLLVLPAMLVTGALYVLSPALLWWFFQLPKQRIVVMGAVCVFGALALIGAQLWLALPGGVF